MAGAAGVGRCHLGHSSRRLQRLHRGRRCHRAADRPSHGAWARRKPGCALSASQASAADRRRGADNRPAWLAGARALLSCATAGSAIGTDPGDADQGGRAHTGIRPHGARAQHLGRPWRRAAPRAIPGNHAGRRRRAFAARPDKRPLLRRLETAYPFQVDCAERTCSLALLSRLPFGGGGRRAHRLRAAGLRVGQARRLARRIIGTQLNRPSRNPWLHELQMEGLAQFVRRIDSPLVLAGDLNTSPWSNAFRARGSQRGSLPPPPVPSWPAWPLALPQVALDHIFVSPELAVAAAGTGPAVGSDHLPVWAQLRRRPIAGIWTSRARSRLAAARPHLGGELFGDLGGEQVAREICAGDRFLGPTQGLGHAVGLARPSASSSQVSSFLRLRKAKRRRPRHAPAGGRLFHPFAVLIVQHRLEGRLAPVDALWLVVDAREARRGSPSRNSNRRRRSGRGRLRPTTSWSFASGIGWGAWFPLEVPPRSP